ncbi:DUF4365 domain-containing protein [Pseudonocardia alni]|uniref:DUF4365 domain-containing protein n=1 Tax=Pseudonocardia alni TaxID=33907 RepID=UPI0033174EEB
MGEAQVYTKFTALGWGPIKNETHDLGTDLYVQTRDDKLSDRGLLLAVQVKAGDSRFRAPERDQSGKIVGWWFDSDTRHFDDWVRHGLPHILVLNKNTEEVAYWVHVTADSVVSTGSTCKILVPENQRIDENWRDELLAVAATQRKGFDLQGSLWRHNSTHSPSPAAAFRYALLAPRLVAPHPNETINGELKAEQALALIVGGRLLEFHVGMERKDTLPSLERMKRRKWEWRLVAAFWEQATNDRDLPEKVLTSAKKPHQVAAAVVLRSCVLAERDSSSAAVDLISSHLDTLDGVDRAWLLIHRAWRRLEYGEVSEAREDAALCQRLIVGETFDVSAFAVRAAAADLLFRTAGSFGTSNIGSVLRSTDIATTWWRSQTLYTGAEAALNSFFKDWADDRSVTWSAIDKAAVKFYSAATTALHAADQGEWRAAERLRARHEILAGQKAGENERIEAGLNALRSCGDDKSMDAAARRLWRTGPLEPIKKSALLAARTEWTRTSALASLILLREGADLLPEQEVSNLVRSLLKILGDDRADFIKRCRPRFFLEHHIGKVVRACLSVSRSSSVHENVADYLISQATTKPHDPQQDDLARLAMSLDASLLQPETVDRLYRSCARRSTRCVIAILGTIRDHDERARKRVNRHANRGETFALGQFGDLRKLSSSGARKTVDRCIATVNSITEEALKHSYRGGAPDSPRTLAIMNCWFPDHAEWVKLIDFLGNSTIPGEYKRGACLVLARTTERIPEEFRDRLVEAALTLTGNNFSIDFLEEPLGGAGLDLLLALLPFDDDRLGPIVAAALTGTWQERRDVCSALGRMAQPESWGVLGALASDSHIDVRAAAARAITLLAIRDEAYPLADALMYKLIDDPGGLIPHHVAHVLEAYAREGSPDAVRRFATRLQDHSLTRTRRAARSALAAITV